MQNTRSKWYNYSITEQDLSSRFNLRATAAGDIMTTWINKRTKDPVRVRQDTVAAFLVLKYKLWIEDFVLAKKLAYRRSRSLSVAKETWPRRPDVFEECCDPVEDCISDDQAYEEIVQDMMIQQKQSTAVNAVSEPHESDLKTSIGPTVDALTHAPSTPTALKNWQEDWSKDAFQLVELPRDPFGSPLHNSFHHSLRHKGNVSSSCMERTGLRTSSISKRICAASRDSWRSEESSRNGRSSKGEASNSIAGGILECNKYRVNVDTVDFIRFIYETASDYSIK